MNIFTILVTFLLVEFSNSQIDRLNFKFYRHPDSFLKLPRIIRKYGYPLEIHKVVTDDGHILSTFRIPYGRKQPQSRTNRSAVLIMHGMGGTPDHFSVLGPGRALIYYLADQGFDVWLLSARGGWDSGGHVKYNWDVDQQFWNFSWHHIGVYDIKANVDYVINKTGQKKVFFIGHSSGGTSYFALSSEIPEISKKIKIAVGLATSCFMEFMDSPVMKTCARAEPLGQAVADWLGFEEPPPPGGNAFLNHLVKIVCSEMTLFAEVCVQVMGVIASHESAIFDKKLVGLIVASMPARVASKQSFHFAQMVNSGRFAKYDFGLRRNKIIYGAPDPPEYNLSNSHAPVALFYGPRDFMAHPRGVLKLASKLPNVIHVEEVPFADFNHLDFLFGTNVTELLYASIVRLFNNYDKGIIPKKIKITNY